MNKKLILILILITVLLLVIFIYPKTSVSCSNQGAIFTSCKCFGLEKEISKSNPDKIGCEGDYSICYGIPYGCKSIDAIG